MNAIAALDVEVIVPGHGEPCDKRYLVEQAQIVQNWAGVGLPKTRPLRSRWRW